MACSGCCPRGVNKNQGAPATRSPQKTCGAALGIILMIGGGVAAGVLYSYLGYVALACLAAVPVGLAITYCSCRKTGGVVGEAILKDTSIPWNDRLTSYFCHFLISNKIRSCKICIQVNDNRRINVPADFTITAQQNIMDEAAQITRRIQNEMKNSRAFHLIWGVITKNPQQDRFNYQLFVMVINEDGTIILHKKPPRFAYPIPEIQDEFKKTGLDNELKNTGITRSVDELTQFLADI